MFFCILQHPVGDGSQFHSLSQGLDIRTYTQDQLTAFVCGFYTRNIINESQKHSINGIHISLCHPPMPPTIPPLSLHLGRTDIIIIQGRSIYIKAGY